MRGDRDKKVTIKQLDTNVGDQNEYGEISTEQCYVVFKENVWASVSPIKGREFWQAEQIQSNVTTRIEFDFFPGITRSMRIYYSNRIFKIVAVIDVNEMHRTLQLMCEEVEHE
jgi:SPP1 family predicted phage head-tail adaptor